MGQEYSTQLLEPGPPWPAYVEQQWRSDRARELDRLGGGFWCSPGRRLVGMRPGACLGMRPWQYSPACLEEDELPDAMPAAASRRHQPAADQAGPKLQRQAPVPGGMKCPGCFSVCVHVWAPTPPARLPAPWLVPVQPAYRNK